ncbi:MAG: biliverdin-producing heme oxygenase [Bradyrhizobium sp.]
MLTETSRIKRLFAVTDDQHAQLDESFKALDAFADRERYGSFVQAQHLFYRDLDPLYSDERLGELIPGLANSARLHLLERDLADLGLAPAIAEEDREFDRLVDADLPTAIGWLYVAEGAKLGAALLLRRADELGLSEAFGARHLAAAPDGRSLPWKTFAGAVDALSLSDDEDARAIDGARAALARFDRLLSMLMVQS